MGEGGGVAGQETPSGPRVADQGELPTFVRGWGQGVIVTTELIIFLSLSRHQRLGSNITSKRLIYFHEI